MDEGRGTMEEGRGTMDDGRQRSEIRFLTSDITPQTAERLPHAFNGRRPGPCAAAGDKKSRKSCPNLIF
jgi:hypothetical protein